MAEAEAISLREALHEQQQILHNLYRELDAERESAETAASETMSMILRLQGEKSVLKMEANQYKRMAEEKMCHAEEALALCEDLMYQKEMEIASLQFQIQSYRNKLLAMGVSDEPGLLLSHKSDTLAVEKIVPGNVRRLNSLPQWKIGFDKEQDATTTRTFDEGAEFQEALEKKSAVAGTGGDRNSYWEKIKRLDARLQEISARSKDHDGSKAATLWSGGTWSPSSYSQLREGNGIGNEQVKTMLHSSSNEKKAPKDAPVDDHHSLPPPPPPPPPPPATAAHSLVSATDYQKLMRRIERLERERNIGQRQQEIVSCGRSTEEEDQMHLLKAIQEQLNGIQNELRSRKAKRVPDNEPCLDVLQEAMLYFWL